MDQTRLLQLEEQCIQNQPAACVTACPVHVDARALLAAAARDDFAEARRAFTQAVPFPHVIARCCEAPCEAACVRGQVGGAIRVRDLERAAMAYGAEAKPATAFRRKKPGRIAVIGAGLAGLSCAYELARKGYAVVIFEEGDGPGGRARELAGDVLPAAELEADCAVVTAAGAELVPFTRVALEYPRKPNALAELAPGVDAIFVAMGAAEADAGAALGYDLDERGDIAVDPITLATSKPTIYCGGGMLRPDAPWSPIASIADGRRAALSIERQLQRVSLGGSRGDRGAYDTRMVVKLDGVAWQAPAEPADPAAGYARSEAVAEAERCLQCECLQCVKVCPYLEAFGAYPGLYARRIYNNLTVTRGRGTRSLNKMIDSCSLCRLCYEVCPTDLDMAEVTHDARREMVRQERMPASHFDGALRDLELARSDRFALARHAPGTQASEAVFFPGCQLAASDPRNVERVYAHLRARLSPATGLLLTCCGAPACAARSRASARPA
jgi:NADPH-dependent glutamate synthase beta subunit-like oxidoreductase